MTSLSVVKTCHLMYTAHFIRSCSKIDMFSMVSNIVRYSLRTRSSATAEIARDVILTNRELAIQGSRSSVVVVVPIDAAYMTSY